MADLAIAIKIAADTSRAINPISSVTGALGALSKAASAPARALGGVTNAIGGMVTGLGTIGLAANGLGSLASGFSSLAADAIEAQQVTAQTASVLKSTGGVAGMTADSVGDLATALSKVTPFEDETVQSAENMLLTFTNIGQKVFPQATETVLDMATALGEDTKEASIQLGKALNDPIQGVTALRRVGVQLSDDQQQQVKDFMAVNDVASAQNVILQELQKEFGGSARAAGQTFGGQMKILETQIGNLKEAAFTPLLAVVGQFATGLTEFVSNDDFIDWVSSTAEMVSGTLSKAFETFGDVLTGVQGFIAAFTTDAGGMGIVLDQVRKIFGDTVADAIEPFVQAFMDAIPQIKAFASLIFDRFQILGQIVTKVLGGDVHGAFDLFQGDLLDNTKQIATTLKDWAGAFLGWIGPMIPPLLAQMQDLGKQLYGWILGTALPALVSMLGEWAGAFIDWVVPLIPPLLKMLGQMLTDMVGWMVDVALPLVLENLAKWGAAFIEWVAPRIPPFLAELGKLLLELGGWMLNTALPAILERLERWGKAFVEWIAPMIPPFLAELATVSVALLGWLKDRALDLAQAFITEWVPAFLNWVATDLVPKIPPTFQAMLDASGAWLTGTAVPWAAENLPKLGTAMVDAIAAAFSGLGGALQAVFSQIKIDVGPFHLSAAGFTIDAPTLPKIGLPGVSNVSQPAGGDTAAQMRDYIGRAAGVRGIDPATAVRVAAAESGNFTSFVGDQQSSFGPFQLHVGGVASGGNAVGGLGDTFIKQTGLDLRDLKTWVDQVNFALDYAATHGWAAWHAAAAVGIGDWQGIGVPIRDATTQLETFNGVMIPAGDAIDNFAGHLTPLGGTLGDLTIRTGDASGAFVAFGTEGAAGVDSVSTAVANFSGQDALWQAIRDNASTTGRDLSTFLKDTGAVAVDLTTASLTELQARSGLTSVQVSENAASAGQDIRHWLLETGVPAADALRDSIKIAGDRTDLLSKSAVDLKDPVSGAKAALGALATDGMQVATDRATQTAAVLLNMREGLLGIGKFGEGGGLIDAVHKLRDAVAELQDKTITITTNYVSNGSAGGGGGSSSSGSAGGGGSSGGGGGGSTVPAPPGGYTPGFGPSGPTHPGQSGPGGIYNNPSTGQPYAMGGTLWEPVLGMGLRTGRKYSFAETGPEEWGGVGNVGMGSDRLAAALEALAKQPIVIQLNGQTLARVTRDELVKMGARNVTSGVV